jgi:hypothetical protein
MNYNIYSPTKALHSQEQTSRTDILSIPIPSHASVVHALEILNAIKEAPIQRPASRRNTRQPSQKEEREREREEREDIRYAETQDSGSINRSED